MIIFLSRENMTIIKMEQREIYEHLVHPELIQWQDLYDITLVYRKCTITTILIISQ
jgi:hypothetical protein